MIKTAVLMKVKEEISIENFEDSSFKIRVVEPWDYKEAAFTHYIHNHKNGVSQFYKPTAIDLVGDVLKYKTPTEPVNQKIAERALQKYLFNFKNDAIRSLTNRQFDEANSNRNKKVGVMI